MQAQIKPQSTQLALPFELVERQYRNGNYQRYGIVKVPSSDGKREYRVDVTNGRCDCPAWKFQKGHGKVCKHLKALGFKDKPAELTKTAYAETDLL